MGKQEKGEIQMEILKVENLNKTYGKGENKVEALKNINLSVAKGGVCSHCGSIRFW